jgi:hypothetical protein
MAEAEDQESRLLGDLELVTEQLTRVRARIAGLTAEESNLRVGGREPLSGCWRQRPVTHDDP